MSNYAVTDINICHEKKISFLSHLIMAQHYIAQAPDAFHDNQHTIFEIMGYIDELEREISELKFFVKQQYLQEAKGKRVSK